MEKSKLIFDVGMHKGEDTEFYLSRGCRVVGIEANPGLVEHLRRKFSRELSDGTVVIIDKIISAKAGKVRFISYPEFSEWGTISGEFKQRNETVGAEGEELELEAVTMEDIIREYGAPYYMKVDIEGMDMCCVEALRNVSERPRYVSIESAVTSGVAEPEDAFNEIGQLWALGYRSFKYVDQGTLDKLTGTLLDKEGAPIRYEYQPGASGPFGEESPGRWRSADEILRRRSLAILYQNTIGFGGRHSSRLISKAGRLLYRIARRIPNHSWFDLHARLG